MCTSLQWDILLLEVGAVCIVAAPWTSLRLQHSRHSRPLPLYPSPRLRTFYR
jgi:hypothetical protein